MRPPNFTPRETPKGWMLSVPASMSSTGKRRRLYFRTQAEALREAKRIRRFRQEHGNKAPMLDASKASEAVVAAEILSELGDVTLVEAAKFMVEHHRLAEASESLLAMIDSFAVEKTREARSEEYLRDIRKLRRITDSAGKGSVEAVHASLDDVEEILAGYGGVTQRDNGRRILRAAFADSIRRGKCAENPMSRTKSARVAKSKDIVLLDLATVRKVFAACIDHSENEDLVPDIRRDCTDAAAAFAVQLFAGLRPYETARLRWEQIDFEDGVIRLDGSQTKTKWRRFVPIEDNLREWLLAVPEDQRAGQVIPSSWERKSRAVRQVAGVPSGSAGTVMRHSYASNWLAIHSDADALRSRLGHGESQTLFRHYAAAVRRKDAITYWQIAPDGKKPQAIRVA